VRAPGLSLGLALALWSCRPPAQRGAAADTTAAPPAPVSDVSRPPITKPSAADTGAPRTLDNTLRRTESDLSRAVHEILASGALVGLRVRVTGRCLGYSKPVAVGGPPRTRSDWQLEADGVAIYVTGPLPAGCSPTEGATETTTIVAVVAEDTLPARGERAAMARRYLVRVLQ